MADRIVVVSNQDKAGVKRKELLQRCRRLIDRTLEKLGHQLEKGYSDEMQKYLRAMAHFHTYSLNNVFLIMSQKPNATRVAGFRTWVRLGRYVRKGEKAIRIFAPVTHKRKKPDEVVEEGKQEDDAENQDRREDTVTVFRSVCVFDVSQTQGVELPEPSKASGAASQTLPALEQSIRDQGITLRYGDTGSALGLSTKNKIIIRPGMTQAETFATLAHEYAHALLHHGPDEKGKAKTIKELEADAVACIVSEHFGISSVQASADYIKMWDGNKDKLFTRLERIRDCASTIIEAVEKHYPPEPGKDRKSC